MPQHWTLTADQSIALGNGMRAAAAKYREIAAELNAQAERLNDPTQHVDSFAHKRMAQHFERQEQNANQLAHIIESATDVAIIP